MPPPLSPSSSCNLHTLSTLHTTCCSKLLHWPAVCTSWHLLASRHTFAHLLTLGYFRRATRVARSVCAAWTAVPFAVLSSPWHIHDHFLVTAPATRLLPPPLPYPPRITSCCPHTPTVPVTPGHGAPIYGHSIGASARIYLRRYIRRRDTGRCSAYPTNGQQDVAS